MISLRKNQLKYLLLLTLLVSLLVACQVQGFSPLFAGESVTQEIRLSMPEASEVYLVWGINGWQTIPSNNRPNGTFLRDSLMYTPMVLDANEFSASVQVPDEAVIDFGFLATVDDSGNPVQIWIANGDQDFHVTAEKGAVFQYQQDTLATEVQTREADQTRLVNWVINYSLPGAEEVLLVWGIDGWKALSQQLQPDGTSLQNGLMMTPLLKNGKSFSITLTVPKNVELDYRFLTTKDRDGKLVEFWDPSKVDGYHDQIQKDGSSTIESWLQIKQVGDSTRLLAAGLYLFIGLVLVVIVGVIFTR